MSLFLCLSVTRFASLWVKRRRIARVFLCRRSRGRSAPSQLLLRSVIHLRRLTLLVLVELAEVLALFEVDDGEHTSDGLSNSVAAIRQYPFLLFAFFRPLAPTPTARDPESPTHILVNLLAEPPAIFCTRRDANSVLSSLSWVRRSFLLLQLVSIASLSPTEHALGLQLECPDLSGRGGHGE